MSKYKGRINTVMQKTHRFVSHEDFCLARDYLQWWFDQEAKPTDLDEKMNELISLHEDLNKKNDPVALARFREILGSGAAIWLKASIADAEDFCRRYPVGVWFQKNLGDFYLKYAKCRRDYLRQNSAKR